MDPPPTLGFLEPRQNEWLGVLPISDYARIRPSLASVDLKKTDVLWEAGDPRRYLYFPTTALIGLMHESQDGHVVEVGMIGRTGMVGIVTFLGDARMGVRAVVHRKGRAYRIKGKLVDDEFDRNSAFRDLCLSYTETFITTLSVDGVCNRLHSVEQQTCKYLLSHEDNVENRIVHATHHEISDIVGVQRSSVSTALMDLRGRGLISYTRGAIVLLDRKALEKIVCECYAEIRVLHQQVLSDLRSKLRSPDQNR